MQIAILEDGAYMDGVDIECPYCGKDLIYKEEAMNIECEACNMKFQISDMVRESFMRSKPYDGPPIKTRVLKCHKI